MILVNHEGRHAWKLEFVGGETIAEMILRLKNEFEFTFKGGSFKVQETTLGRELPPEETVVDGREYYLTGWITTTGPGPVPPTRMRA